MNKAITTIIIGLVALLGCKPKTPAGNAIPATSCNCQSNENSIAFYQYKDDTLCQTAAIINKQKDFIDFDLVTCNNRTKKQSRLVGKAMLSVGMNSEMDMDESGDAYPVDLFVYKNAVCTVNLRFDADSGRLLQIKEYKCEGLHDVSCPFGADNILVRE